MGEAYARSSCARRREGPWGVRRFFVEDPGGTVVNVLAHLA